METNTKPRYICRFKGKNDCISYEWKEVSKEANMKIDVEESIVYKFDSKEDLSQAVLVLGEKGYFSDTEDFITYEYGILSEVKCWVEGCKNPFLRSCEEEESNCYRYFIAEDAVAFKREEPKKYRPFKDIGEFSFETCCEVLGDDHITIRNKNTQKECVLLYIGYSDEEVHLGGYVFTFADLLKNYEFSYNDEWCPFGIEE